MIRNFEYLSELQTTAIDFQRLECPQLQLLTIVRRSLWDQPQPLFQPKNEINKLREQITVRNFPNIKGLQIITDLDPDRADTTNVLLDFGTLLQLSSICIQHIGFGKPQLKFTGRPSGTLKTASFSRIPQSVELISIMNGLRHLILDNMDLRTQSLTLTKLEVLEVRLLSNASHFFEASRFPRLTHYLEVVQRGRLADRSSNPLAHISHWNLEVVVLRFEQRETLWDFDTIIRFDGILEELKNAHERGFLRKVLLFGDFSGVAQRRGWLTVHPGMNTSAMDKEWLQLLQCVDVEKRFAETRYPRWAKSVLSRQSYMEALRVL